MGATELALLLKYGIPLVIKLLGSGMDAGEVTGIVGTVVGMINNKELIDFLVGANDEQATGIVDMLFGLITALGKK